MSDSELVQEPPQSQEVDEDSVSSSSDEEEDPTRPLETKHIPSAREMYKSGTMKPAAKNRYPADAKLLERISIHQGDITKLKVDCIVNAANNRLLGGGGVDGAIHAAAGQGLLEECRRLNGASTGESKITGGHCLPSRFVVHTVGPVYSSSDVKNKASQLKSCYKTSLDLAVKHELLHIAFPSISTGVYDYPIADATHIALDVMRKFLQTDDTIERIICVVWSNKDLNVYR